MKLVIELDEGTGAMLAILCAEDRVLPEELAIEAIQHWLVDRLYKESRLRTVDLESLFRGTAEQYLLSRTPYLRKVILHYMYEMGLDISTQTGFKTTETGSSYRDDQDGPDPDPEFPGRTQVT